MNEQKNEVIYQMCFDTVKIVFINDNMKDTEYTL